VPAVVDQAEQGQQETPLLGRARAVFRRTSRDLKDALQTVARLEQAAHRCYVGADQEIDDEIANSVAGLLREVREQYPNQELEVVVFAAPEEARGGERNGHDRNDRPAGSVGRH
jgi:hypothetical protein